MVLQEWTGQRYFLSRAIGKERVLVVMAIFFRLCLFQTLILIWKWEEKAENLILESILLFSILAFPVLCDYFIKEYFRIC